MTFISIIELLTLQLKRDKYVYAKSIIANNYLETIYERQSSLNDVYLKVSPTGFSGSYFQE